MMPSEPCRFLLYVAAAIPAFALLGCSEDFILQPATPWTVSIKLSKGLASDADLAKWIQEKFQDCIQKGDIAPCMTVIQTQRASLLESAWLKDSNRCAFGNAVLGLALVCKASPPRFTSQNGNWNIDTTFMCYLKLEGLASDSAPLLFNADIQNNGDYQACAEDLARRVQVIERHAPAMVQPYSQ